MAGAEDGRNGGLAVIREADRLQRHGELSLPEVDRDLVAKDRRRPVGDRGLDLARNGPAHRRPGIADVVRHKLPFACNMVGPTKAGQGEEEKAKSEKSPGEYGERGSVLGQIP